jgi:hypothetical protein
MVDRLRQVVSIREQNQDVLMFVCPEVFLLSFRLRPCPDKNISIQVSKFPRAHIPFIRDSTWIFGLVGLVFR